MRSRAGAGQRGIPGLGEVRDPPAGFQRAGNIIAEIAQLNRIRRQNPALHTHLGLKVYNAWNDNILYFGKRSEDGSNFILVAVSLDPHNAQEAHFRITTVGNGLAGRRPDPG